MQQLWMRVIFTLTFVYFVLQFTFCCKYGSLNLIFTFSQNCNYTTESCILITIMAALLLSSFSFSAYLKLFFVPLVLLSSSIYDLFLFSIFFYLVVFKNNYSAMQRFLGKDSLDNDCMPHTV